jgi:hypothetical protein
MSRWWTSRRARSCWQFAPQWLIGIEGDPNWADLTVPAGSRDVNWLGSLRGRIGWSPTATTMLYFTGGAAWSTVTIPGVDTLPRHPDENRMGCRRRLRMGAVGQQLALARGRYPEQSDEQ